MIPSDGVSTLFKEAALKRIEQILLAEWREKKDFYQQIFEEYVRVVLENNAEKEMAIYATGFMDGIYTARKVMDQEYK